MHYEKLDVYQCSVEFLSLSYRILESSKKGYASVLDQLRRASVSIPLNIAEASGKTGIADRKKFYSISRGSAMECYAIFDVIVILEVYPNLEDVKRGKALLTRIVEMLTKMCR